MWLFNLDIGHRCPFFVLPMMWRAGWGLELGIPVVPRQVYLYDGDVQWRRVLCASFYPKTKALFGCLITLKILRSRLPSLRFYKLEPLCDIVQWACA